MAEAAAATAAADVAQELICAGFSMIGNEIRLVRGAKKEVLGLANELKVLRTVLDNAESRRFHDKSINHWLPRLEQTSYEMEDVLHEWSYTIHKHKMATKPKVCTFLPSSCLYFDKVVVRHDIATKVKYLKEQLLREKVNFVNMPTTDRLPESHRDQTTSSVQSTKVHGRDRDMNILVRKLLDNGCSQEESRTHIIVGMGGLGKTTLAQLAYNHDRVEKSFPIRIWISVSHPFDLAAIGRGILEVIHKRTPENTIQLDALFAQVKMSLSGKRFLLVLDDVRYEIQKKWETLENYLECGGAGSKILVTTRDDRVVQIMRSRDNEICRLRLLTDEDCKLLLCRIALSGRKGVEVELEEIGKEIAKKCNGLPLTAKTLGSLLRRKSSVEEWENVLESEIWKLEEAKVDIFPHLLLSYNELSPTLKRCFSYCVVFPKDTRIDVEWLIGKWTALGYLDSDDMDSIDMDVKGREYFDILADCSLFHDFQYKNKKIISFKMHNMIHVFANFLRKSGRVEGATCQACDSSFVSTVNEFRSLFWYDEEFLPSFCDCLTCLRVLSMNKCRWQSIPQGIEKLIHLRWLDLSVNTLSHENLKIIFQLYYLQTLRLSDCNLEDIPNEIGNLIHLRRLDLSCNKSLKELPREIENLVLLRHLNLCNNESLKELPTSICVLHVLRTLDISRCKSLSTLPEGVAQLTGLRTLNDFYGGSGWSKLGLLKNLNHIRESLRLIIRLTDDDLGEVVEDARRAELRKKEHIKHLVIKFEDEMDENEPSCGAVRIDMIDALEPHPKLQQLHIVKYKGSKLPLSWMVSPLKFDHLRFIQLDECNHLSSLPSLGKLPCLEAIDIYAAQGLESVGREFLGVNAQSASSSTITAFPKLKTLSFWNCPDWKEWEDITAEEDEEEHRSDIMPCLKELTIINCSSLTTLPLSLLRKAWPLQKLDIYGSLKLQQYCRGNGVEFVDC